MKTMHFFIHCLFALMLISLTARAGNNENPAIYSVKPLIKPRVALTFDDGPHAILTPRLMDILKPLNANVTFFVMGIKVEKHATILQRAVREGHEIANHVWNHPILSKIPRETVFDQLWKTNMAIQRAIGFAPKIMRPPYGNTNKPLNQFIAERGNLSVIMWSFDTQDWKHPGSKAIVDRALQKIKVESTTNT